MDFVRIKRKHLRRLFPLFIVLICNIFCTIRYERIQVILKMEIYYKQHRPDEITQKLVFNIKIFGITRMARFEIKQFFLW